MNKFIAVSDAVKDLILAIEDPVRCAADQAKVFMEIREEDDFG